jgi:hypothetical protein
MREELGVDLDDWQPVGQLDVAIDHRRDRVHCFQAELHPPPQLTLDLGELSAAQWFDRHALPPVGRYTQQILALVDEQRVT